MRFFKISVLSDYNKQGERDLTKIEPHGEAYIDLDEIALMQTYPTYTNLWVVALNNDTKYLINEAEMHRILSRLPREEDS